MGAESLPSYPVWALYVSPKQAAGKRRHLPKLESCFGGIGTPVPRSSPKKESPSHGCAVPAPFNKGAFGAGPGHSSTQAPLVKGGRAAGGNPGAGGFRNPEPLKARNSLSHRLRRRQLPQRGSLSLRGTGGFRTPEPLKVKGPRPVSADWAGFYVFTRFLPFSGRPGRWPGNIPRRPPGSPRR